MIMPGMSHTHTCVKCHILIHAWVCDIHNYFPVSWDFSIPCSVYSAIVSNRPHPTTFFGSIQWCVSITNLLCLSVSTWPICLCHMQLFSITAGAVCTYAHFRSVGSSSPVWWSQTYIKSSSLHSSWQRTTSECSYTKSSEVGIISH